MSILTILKAAAGFVSAKSPAFSKVALAVVAGAVFWFSGYQYAQNEADKKATAERLAVAKREAEAANAYRAALAETLRERDEARAMASDDRRRADVLADRLRRASAANRPGSADACRKRLRQCEELLAESVELAGWGQQLLRELDANRRAMTKK